MDPAPPGPPVSQTPNTLQIATLAGVAVMAVLTWASWREVGKTRESLHARLEAIEGRLDTVTKSVTDAVAAARQQPNTPQRRTGPDPDLVFPVKTAGRPVRGPMDAPITIAEFSDFQ